MQPGTTKFLYPSADLYNNYNRNKFQTVTFYNFNWSRHPNHNFNWSRHPNHNFNWSPHPNHNFNWSPHPNHNFNWSRHPNHNFNYLTAHTPNLK